MICLRAASITSKNHTAKLVATLRTITTTSAWAKKHDQLPPRPTLPDDALHHVSLKGSGPGGQKINKTNSAIQITHLPTGLVVKSQATRSRTQNYTIARRILAEKVELLQKGDEARVVKKQERASKKKASADKKKRRKYKKLDDGQDNNAEADDESVAGRANGNGTTLSDVAYEKDKAG